MSRIEADPAIQQQLQSRGITEKTGVFGEHKVQIGTGKPIRLDSIKSNKIPFQGFTSATKALRGQEGVRASAEDTFKVLCRPGTLDAKALLSTLKTTEEYLGRLDKLGELTPQQKENTLWVFAPAVEHMSNAELAAVYQNFTTAEMDLLQTALMREGQINAKATDARSAASVLFDLQALVLKEVSNRAVRGMVDDLVAAHPEDPELTEIRMPPRLSEQYGAQGAALTASSPHDITSANLLTLVETAAQSATTREQTATRETERLHSRNLPSVSVKDMADVLRSAELTINLPSSVLFEGGILQDPDSPVKNIFHLAQENVLPKGEGYIARRDAAERLLFPELEGHKTVADERPVYAAVNVQHRQMGAVQTAYGSAVIVLKNDVARRATYTAEDTFYAPVANMSQERRANFYALLDGAGLSAEFTSACRDTESSQRKALEKWFDTIAKVPDARTSAFIGLPTGLGLNDDEAEHFKGLLMQCFGDRAATRSLLATYDNLEALIPHMSDFDGNALAMASKKNADGSHPCAVLTGVQYIEAQIHGPLIPSRDIAEIRIDIDDLPSSQEERQAALASLEAFEKRTGVHVNVISGFDFVGEMDALNDLQKAERDFQLKHIDKARIDNEADVVRQDIAGNVARLIEDDNLARDLPPGMLRLEGNALGRLAAKFEQALEANLKRPERADSDPRVFVQQAFRDAALPILQQKVELLKELELLHFENEAQKAGFASWVCSAKALRSPQELRIIHTYATEQAALMRSIADSDPAPSATDLFRSFGEITKKASEDLNAFIAELGDPEFGADDKNNELDRISFMSLSLLKNGNPAMDNEALKALHDRLAAPELRHLVSQFEQFGMRPEDKSVESSADFGAMSATIVLIHCNEINSAREAGVRSADRYLFSAELSLIPQSSREALRAVAPQTAARLDEIHPAYAAFPAPAHPEVMPADGAARRQFLVNNLDAYLRIENDFEKGTSVHGRGHIARAFIYAGALCSILEEQGIEMDRNAVMCGITGHDLGRMGRGQDYWEGLSAERTVESMRASFGADAMGEDYERAVKDCIDAHKGKTLETMLLNAADSLDIGRTQHFDPERFAFLHGKDGELHVAEELGEGQAPQSKIQKVHEEPSIQAKRIREQLAVEADLLQRLTNPLCESRNVLDKLSTEIQEGPEFLTDTYMEQYQNLKTAIAEKFVQDQAIDADTYMKNMEQIIADNPGMFPLLSKYYRP